MDTLLAGRVGLFVRLMARPGARAGLLDALHDYTEQLAAEPGTEVFLIALDPDDHDVVWLYEWFQSDTALEEHRATASFASLMERLPDLLASPPGLLRIDPLRLHLKPGIFAGEASEFPN